MLLLVTTNKTISVRGVVEVYLLRQSFVLSLYIYIYIYIYQLVCKYIK